MTTRELRRVRRSGSGNRAHRYPGQQCRHEFAGTVIDRSLDEFDAVLNTDLRASFVIAREAGRRMIARGDGGRIINIGSIGSVRVLPGLTAYCIAKAGMAMMTQCLAREWARHDINVTRSALVTSRPNSIAIGSRPMAAADRSHRFPRGGCSPQATSTGPCFCSLQITPARSPARS